MYIGTTKQPDGYLRVEYTFEEQHLAKMFLDESESRHWVINHLQIEG